MFSSASSFSCSATEVGVEIVLINHIFSYSSSKIGEQENQEGKGANSKKQIG
jgi:hypothetical protein